MDLPYPLPCRRLLRVITLRLVTAWPERDAVAFIGQARRGGDADRGLDRRGSKGLSKSDLDSGRRSSGLVSGRPRWLTTVMTTTNGTRSRPPDTRLPTVVEHLAWASVGYGLEACCDASADSLIRRANAGANNRPGRTWMGLSLIHI